MNKKSPFWMWLAAWVVLSLLSCYIRLYPLRAHMWDDARDEATLMVVYNIKQTFLKQILEQAPSMPPALANQMASQKLNEIIHEQNGKFQDTVDNLTNNLMQQPGAPPQKIYLLESDPFDFYNLTQNIVDTGRIAAAIKGSKYFNPLMHAPFGFWQPFTLHPYWGFAIYKFLQLFNPHISLMAAVAATPLFTYMIIIAVFLWICSVLNYSVLSAFVGALFLVMAPINLKRGALGWYRTDPYNILFPLMLIGCLFLALRPATKKSGYLWAAVYGLVLGVYALFWQGWGLLFFTGMFCALAVAGYNVVIKKDMAHAKQNLIFEGIYIAATTLVVSLCFSFGDFFILFKEGFGELAKFTHRGLDLWPNMFLTVGELKKPSLASLTTLGSMTTANGAPSNWGDLIFVMLAIGGWFYTLRLAVENPRSNKAIDTLIVSLFLIITLGLSCFGGERFILFTTIPLSILAAAAANRFIGLKTYGLPLAGLLVAFVLFNASRDIRTILTPIYNSAWDEALTAVKKETPADSIVNTWWAPGHFIKGVANRAVPFDGASIDQSAIGYWMGNMFLAQDENQAAGILRMINSSGNEAADYLVNQCGMKLSDATSLLLGIASQDRDQAAQTLKGILTDDQANTVLNFIYGKKPHSYVLVYTELVDENLMVYFAGHWNIKKIEDINASPELLKSVPKRSSMDFIDFLFNTMGGRPKFSEVLPFIGQNKNQLVFAQNLMVDPDTMDAQIQSDQYGQGHPYSVFYLNNGQVQEHVNPDGDLNYSVLLYQEDGQYAARLMDRALANSMIMKLYYYNGAGLNHFKPLVLSHDPTGRTRIKVFQVVY